FTVFNPRPEAVHATVALDVPNVDNSRRQPALRNPDGTPIPMQVVAPGFLAHQFGLLARVDLPAGGCAEVRLDWSRDELPPLPAPVDLPFETTVASDTINLRFREGQLATIENLKNGRTLQASDGAAFFEPMALPQEAEGWMTKSFANNPLPFLPKRLWLEECGPLRFRLMRSGFAGPYAILQAFDLCQGEPTVEVTTTVDLVMDTAYVVLGFPLPGEARLSVDIPFGVEDRDLSRIRYGYLGGWNYENIERRLPGIFWGRSWVFAEASDASFGLVTADGPRYFRRHGDPLRLLHFLADGRTEQRSGWMANVGQERALGRHTFRHQFVLAGGTWREADMVGRAQRLRTPPQVLPGIPTTTVAPFEVQPETVRLSAFYREGDDILIRLVNMGSRIAATAIRPPFAFGGVTSVDFLNRPMGEQPIARDGAIHFTLQPWQIVTLRFARNLSAQGV
ncbi:MAG: hypothetical protein PHR35_22475, partial [Kiritimatiellae bacterium]|nr:hypothetical protein [Kiritimatiellia bacterium]